MLFGQQIRNLRESQNLVLRKVAAELDIDTATMSKIDRGTRKGRKEHVFRLAEILNKNSSDLLLLWNADTVLSSIRGENQQFEILSLAKQLLDTE